jgi:hypothetical protein
MIVAPVILRVNPLFAHPDCRPVAAEGFADQFAMPTPGKDPEPNGELLRQVEYSGSAPAAAATGDSPTGPRSGRPLRLEFAAGVDLPDSELRRGCKRAENYSSRGAALLQTAAGDQNSARPSVLGSRQLW